MPLRKKTQKPVQISLDAKLLKDVDADAEARSDGRSAFITRAILLYMRAKREKLLDEQIIAALSPRAAEIEADSRDLIASQAWPPDDDLVEEGETPPSRKRAARGR